MMIGLPSITEWNTSEHRLIFVAIVNRVKVTVMTEQYSQREQRRKRKKKDYIYFIYIILYQTVKSQFVWFLRFFNTDVFSEFLPSRLYIYFYSLN